MKRLYVLAAVALLAWPAAQLAHAAAAPPAVPAELQVDAGNKLFLVAHAVGVQMYACNATGGGYAWSFAGPRATLYDDRGNVVATHYRGPTWEARDGSKVVGQLAKPPVTVDPTAIAWLLLSAASTSVGPDGDRLAGTTYIQRIATTGGIQPSADECNSTTAGTTSEVAYTAEYAFWKRSGS